jgi:hypothetical protein
MTTPTRFLRRQPLIRFLIAHCLIGIAAGWLMLAGLLALDVGGLGTLIMRSAAPWLAIAVLAFGIAVTFGSASMGAAIMSLHRGNGGGDERGGRPARRRIRALVPVRIGVRRR